MIYHKKKNHKKNAKNDHVQNGHTDFLVMTKDLLRYLTVSEIIITLGFLLNE